MNAEPDASSVPDAPSPPPTTSIGSRMFNVFATPGEVFEEVAAQPPATANWLLPALLLMVVGWIGSWLIFAQPAIQQQLRDLQNDQIQKMVEKGKMSQEQADQAKQAAEKFGNIMKYVGAAVAPVLAAFASPFWWALLLWLIGRWALGARFSYMKAVEVAGLSNMIVVLESVVKTLLIIVFGSLFAGPHLGLLVMDKFNPADPLHTVLAVVDLAVLWALLVRGIGLARLARTSALKATGWVFVVWLVLTASITGGGLMLQRAFAP